MVLGNIDTLIVSFDIADYEKNNLALFSKLDKAKEEAASLAKDLTAKDVIVELNYVDMKIMGNGKQGYSYLLHNDLLEVNIARFRSKIETFYPVRIRFKSEYIWSCGLKNCWSFIERWTRELFGEITDVKIGRVDPCCHTDIINLQLEKMAYFKGSYRNQNIHLSDRKVSSMNFGSRKSSVYSRIYDKILEVNVTRKKTWFYDIWNSYKMDVNNIWNVEFEIHREFLKEKQINDFTDLYESLKTLWRYLTGQWIVMIKNNNKRTDRCLTDPIWEEIQTAFDKYEDKPLIDRAKQLDYDAKALVPQIIGCIASYGARLGVEDIDYVYSMLNKQGEEYLEKKDLTFDEKIKEKMQAMNHQVVIQK